MKYLFLLGAIIAEVIAALATRQSMGFTKLLPSIIAIVGVIGAYFLFSLSLKHGILIGIAYGMWSALGITLLAMIGTFVLKESINTVQILGLLFIVGGVLALELGK